MEHRLELGKFHVRNLLPNSIYKVMMIVLCSQQAAAYRELGFPALARCIYYFSYLTCRKVSLIGPFRNFLFVCLSVGDFFWY